MSALSAAAVSFEVASIRSRIVSSWKSNARSPVSERKRQTGRMSMRITRPLSRLARFGVSAAGVGEEELLAVDPVGGDRGLPPRRDQPVDEFLPHLLLHVRMLRRVHEHDAVLVEELPVPLDEHHEVAAVLEREPRA